MDFQAPEQYEGEVGGGNVKLKEVLERKRTYKQHREFLQSFQNYREVRERQEKGGGAL